MNQKMELFSNQRLKAMILPLLLEQLFVLLVGMADTLIVSYVGETAVSGVSLVDQLNTIFIYLFNQRHSVFIYNYCMLSIFFALLQVLHRGPKSQVTVNNKKEYQSLFFKKLPFIW